MKVLEEQGGLTEKEIAEFTELTISSVWTALNRLVKSGEVKKTPKITNKTNIKCYIFQITSIKERKLQKMQKLQNNDLNNTKILKC